MSYLPETQVMGSGARHGDVSPLPLTRDVRAARTLWGLVSADIAGESGVDTETVIRVLRNDPDPLDRDDVERLTGWLNIALAS